MTRAAAVLFLPVVFCMGACSASEIVSPLDAGGNAPGNEASVVPNDGDGGGGGGSPSDARGPMGDEDSVPSDAGGGGGSLMDRCTYPDAAIYDCPTDSLDAGFCVGVPQRFGPVPDDASHPVGCTVTLPLCYPLYQSAPMCTCFAANDLSNPTDAAAWSCPL